MATPADLNAVGLQRFLNGAFVEAADKFREVVYIYSGLLQDGKFAASSRDPQGTAQVVASFVAHRNLCLTLVEGQDWQALHSAAEDALSYSARALECSSDESKSSKTLGEMLTSIKEDFSILLCYAKLQLDNSQSGSLNGALSSSIDQIVKASSQNRIPRIATLLRTISSRLASQPKASSASMSHQAASTAKTTPEGRSQTKATLRSPLSGRTDPTSPPIPAPVLPPVEECSTSSATKSKPDDLPRPPKPKKDWDKLAKELEKELDDEVDGGGDAAFKNLMSKLYSEGDDDMKRAMLKSYQTSGGTVLSTNWNEVRSESYEKKIIPPAGLEAKKW